MNIYMTTGTYDYLQQLQEKHKNETMVILKSDEDQAVLLHETESTEIFNEGRDYEVIDQSGDLQGAGFAVLNNIPVSDEGRPLFEYRFQNRTKLIDNEPGFVAIRVLRPISSDTYIILTLWKQEADFLNWKNSKAYDNAHKKRGTSEGIDQQSILPRPSYVTKYHVSTVEN
jgi:heme-degrading monooxygenase HmoA